MSTNPAGGNEQGPNSMRYMLGDGQNGPQFVGYSPKPTKVKPTATPTVSATANALFAFAMDAANEHGPLTKPNEPLTEANRPYKEIILNSVSTRQERSNEWRKKLRSNAVEKRRKMTTDKVNTKANRADFCEVLKKTKHEIMQLLSPELDSAETKKLIIAILTLINKTGKSSWDTISSDVAAYTKIKDKFIADINALLPKCKVIIEIFKKIKNRQ